MNKQEMWEKIKQKDPVLAKALINARKDWPNYELIEVKFKDEDKK